MQWFNYEKGKGPVQQTSSMAQLASASDCYRTVRVIIRRLTEVAACRRSLSFALCSVPDRCSLAVLESRRVSRSQSDDAPGCGMVQSRSGPAATSASRALHQQVSLRETGHSLIISLMATCLVPRRISAVAFDPLVWIQAPVDRVGKANGVLSSSKQFQPRFLK